MPLSKNDRDTVEELAKRHAALINAMTEARCRLGELPQDQLAELYAEVMEGDHNQIPRPEEKDLDVTIRAMEESVKQFWRKSTHKDAMELLKAANAGALLMNSHVSYNYPRLAKAVRIRTSDFHEADFRKRLEDRILPDGRVKVGNHGVTANPIPDYRARGENPDYFQPSEVARSSRQPITPDEFERLDRNHIFNSVFFIKNLDNAQNLTAFEIMGRRDTRNGSIYELRWEGTSRAMNVGFEELQELAQHGLWMSPG